MIYHHVKGIPLRWETCTIFSHPFVVRNVYAAQLSIVHSVKPQSERNVTITMCYMFVDAIVD